MPVVRRVESFFILGETALLCQDIALQFNCFRFSQSFLMEVQVSCLIMISTSYCVFVLFLFAGAMLNKLTHLQPKFRFARL